MSQVALSKTCRTAILVWLPLAFATPAAPVCAETHSPWAGSQAENLAIKLVTYGPGDKIFNYYGHNALIVQDRVRNVERLYNFGMFWFGPTTAPSFMRGKLIFWGAGSFSWKLKLIMWENC